MRRRAWRVRCVRAASPTVRRSIRFEPLSPGEWAYSRSESFWLARCGVLTPDRSNPLYGLWQTLPEDIRLSPNTYLATNSPLGPWWILGWAERVPGVDEVLSAPLPPYRVLTTQVQRAEAAQAGYATAATSGSVRPASAPFPETVVASIT